MPDSLPRNTRCAVCRIANRIFQPIRCATSARKSTLDQSDGATWTFEQQARQHKASATNEDMPRHPTPVPPSNERPRRFATSPGKPRHPQAIFSALQQLVDLPRDPIPLRLPDFRRVRANSSSAVLRRRGALLFARRVTLTCFSHSCDATCH
ncbi:hypothetical protein Scep_004567 [Stephania cephalantha]|uniref:Uncharacterized protein n=1 Tax=Stephania cephalantha TaxID=152367 RepID=A0AAP0KSP7_9MAGN